MVVQWLAEAAISKSRCGGHQSESAPAAATKYDIRGAGTNQGILDELARYQHADNLDLRTAAKYCCVLYSWRPYGVLIPSFLTKAVTGLFL